MQSDIWEIMDRYLTTTDRQRESIEAGELEQLERLIQEKEMLINLMQVEMKSVSEEERESLYGQVRNIVAQEQDNAEELIRFKNELGIEIQNTKMRKKALDSYKNLL